MTVESPLRRQLGLAAVVAVVVGDMLGSGIFFTPGQLALVARSHWQVYFFWGLCGIITLCGALTLADLSSRLPRAGASYHIIREGFGPFWGFLKVWMEMWVSGPGSVAGVAIVFGEFLSRFLGSEASWSPSAWGAAAILLFALINLLGVRWGGRTQILLTAGKLLGLLFLMVGGLLLAAPPPSAETKPAPGGAGLPEFARLVGLGLPAVLFTYDGWVDVSHVAGEVARPEKNMRLGLGLGVGTVGLLYLVVNHAYLRAMPLESMREQPTTFANTLAVRAFGSIGGELLNGLILLSIFGALGGLVMTLPRLFYAAASQYERETAGSKANLFFRGLSLVSRRSAVPAGSILFCAALSTVALVFFGSFSRLVTFFVVPLHFTNVLMVASAFRLRARSPGAEAQYRTPVHPMLPWVYIAGVGLFLLSAIFFNPLDTCLGVAMTATGVPVYLWISRGAGK